MNLFTYCIKTDGLGSQPKASSSRRAAFIGRCRGGYAVVAMINGHGLVGFRDPHGIRPAVLGQRRPSIGPEYMIASECCALDVLGFTLISYIGASEAAYIDMHNRLQRRRRYAFPTCTVLICVQPGNLLHMAATDRRSPG